MARKKLARNQDLESTIRTSIQDVAKILLSEDGPTVLSRWIAFFEQQAAFWTSFRDWLTTTPRNEVERGFEERLGLPVQNTRLTGVLEEDLPGVAETLRGVTTVFHTGLAPTGDQKASRALVRHLMSRDEFKPRRFKKEFEKAFMLRYRMGQNGKRVTIATLTQQLTPYEYKLNPDAALRSMQRGIKRVRAQHERCVALGVQSPFLPVSNKLETKKRHK
jgi:hypothetical protein